MKELKILCEGLNKKYGDATPLSVGLTDTDDKPIQNLPFTITINNKTYSRISDSDGMGYLNINLPVGDYTTTIDFRGTTEYYPNSKNVLVRVTESGGNNLTIMCEDLIKEYKTSTPLRVGFFDNGTPLYNIPFQIIINGVTYNRTTESDGYSTLNINLPVGEYKTEIRYNGSSQYMPQSKYVTVIVTPNNLPPSDRKVNEKNYFEVNGIGLVVKLKDGFSVTPGISIKETDMLMETSTLNAPTFYFNEGNHGIEFDITAIMRESDRYNDYTVMDYLDMWHKNIEPVSVVTDAIDVPNGKYVMIVKSKKQTNFDFTVWKIHFHQFYENNQSFERFYKEKTSTLSAIDLELLKYQLIDKNSPKTAILALQKKLDEWGYFCPYTADGSVYDKRVPNGQWDELMFWDILHFQFYIMKLNIANGECDRKTISALITNYGRLDPNSEYIHYNYYDTRGGYKI